ncbi:MAG TPA: ATPase domain-containing protein [Thermoplasmata archaeon]|jgi:KaiC/GvpD/RAD55 family RecA-like ATPase|nr:ATPase domain-containing protein [Thermoplasmata archaeon]
MTEIVRTFIRGFDGELGGGVPAGHVCLVRGSSGTMKSTLAYSILYRNAEKGRKGLYVTLEQEAASLLGQMATLGFRPASVSDSLPMLDLSRGRDYLEKLAERMRQLTQGKADRPLTAIFKAKVSQLRKEFGFDLIAIDSWDALATVLEFQDRRRETFDLFEWLRGLGCTTLLIAETPPTPDEGLEEEFLSDAILRVRLEPVTETQFQRRLQCSKMRSANHSSDFFTLVFDNAYFEIARAIS